jgi:hypothetical protein
MTMIFVAIFSLLAFLAVLGMIIYRHLFTPERSNGFWLGGPLTNLASFCIGVFLISFSVLFFTDWRQDRRAEERQVLTEVAEAQRKIFDQKFAFGQRSDVIAERPVLFKAEFWVENGTTADTTYLSTTRCRMVLTETRTLGPTCGPPQDIRVR